MGQLILRWKGVVLDSLTEDRVVSSGANKDSTGREKVTEIQKLRSRISQLTLSNQKSDNDEAGHLAQQISEIERSLASRTSMLGRVRQNADITLDAVLPALVKGAVLIDFIQFQDPKLKEDAEKCYGALLLAEDGIPNFIRIDGAKIIDNAIASVRRAISQGDEVALTNNLKVLTEKLWSPIAAKLPPCSKTLIIGPDGALNFMSFATLLDTDGHFLSEKYEVVYVGSGRDLTIPTAKQPGKQMALFANPVFDQNGSQQMTNPLAMRSAEISAFGQIKFPPLPGTEVESQALEKEAKEVGWTTTAYLGGKATEQQIRALSKPNIVHLATHGFYLNSLASRENGTRGMKVVGLGIEKSISKSNKGVDPMRASGIALAGAQATLKSWSEGMAPEPENDGILTAEEVAGLDLQGTWLVTLSACETGLGEAKSGEGVFGLRRAFMMAGAQNLLMTLWPVNDETTAKIMADFYKEALATGDAPGSLAKVQRDWLVKLRKQKNLVSAVRDAGPFVLTTTGMLLGEQELMPALAESSLSSQVSAVPDVKDIESCEEIIRLINKSGLKFDTPEFLNKFSPQFAKLIIEKGFKPDKGENYENPAYLNYDFRYDTQDTLPNIRSIGPSVIDGDKIKVPLVMSHRGENIGEDEDRVVTKTWILIRVNNKWLIDDVVTSTQKGEIIRDGSLFQELFNLKIQ